jgi:NRPS condensation-like uncharacterized protein
MVQSSDLVRTLGAVENLFSAYGDIGAMTFAMMAAFEAPVGENELRAALGAVQARHPLLQVRIGTDAAGNMAFLRSDAPVEVRMKGVGAIDREAELAEAIAEPFAAGAGPLMRAVMIEGAQETVLICVWHHAVADGKGAAAVMRQIVSTLQGRPAEDQAGRGDYTKVSFTYAIDERMQYDAGEGCCRRQRSP